MCQETPEPPTPACHMIQSTLQRRSNAPCRDGETEAPGRGLSLRHSRPSAQTPTHTPSSQVLLPAPCRVRKTQESWLLTKHCPAGRHSSPPPTSRTESWLPVHRLSYCERWHTRWCPQSNARPCPAAARTARAPSLDAPPSEPMGCNPVGAHHITVVPAHVHKLYRLSAMFVTSPEKSSIQFPGQAPSRKGLLMGVNYIPSFPVPTNQGHSTALLGVCNYPGYPR